MDINKVHQNQGNKEADSQWAENFCLPPEGDKQQTNLEDVGGERGIFLSAPVYTLLYYIIYYKIWGLKLKGMFDSVFLPIE